MTGMKRIGMSGLLAALLACGLFTACGAGGGGGGGGSGGNNPPPATATLRTVPAQASVEAFGTLSITPTTSNVDSPVFTYELVPPTSLADLDAETLAARFGSVSADGTFTAGAEATPGLRGSIIVRETSRGLSSEIPIVIVPAIQTITVEPDAAAVLAGQTQTFTATAVDFLDQPVTDFLVDWRVVGGVGTITGAGIFTGTSAGTGQVEARIGGAAPGTADVTVVGSIVGLQIQPLGNPVEVEAGTQRQFRALVGDAAGNQSEVDATWSVTPDTVGTISATGLFTASGNVGAEGTLTATAQGQTTSLPIRIVALIQPPGNLPANVLGTIRLTGGTLAVGATVVALRTSDSTEVARTTTGADGRYGLWLPAGTYSIQATLGAQTATRTNVNLPAQDVRVQVDLILQ